MTMHLFATLRGIGVAGLTAFALVVPAWAQEGAPSARGFIEPPYLAERVASGELPPIDERLPKEPFVVGSGTLLQPEFMDWQDGKYGGTINAAALSATGFINIAGGATLLRSPSQTTEASLPNVLSAFEASPDYTTFTMTIRPGLKWSDGAPVTTEDVRFTIEDLYRDPDVQRPWQSELYTRSNPNLPPAELTVVDENTFVLKFAEPYGFFVSALNSWIPYYDFLIKPSHYLKQFHAKYADADALQKLVTEKGEANWVQLLQKMDVPHWEVGEARALGMPTLNAWVLSEVGETRRVYDRNPYFWHVDASGHQLPYADKVINTQVVDTNAITNAVLAGQVTIASGGEVSLSNMPIYLQNAKRNNLSVFTSGSFNSPIQLFVNYDYQFGVENSAWQAAVSDPEHRFGKALAAAMNPDDINQSVFFGQFGPASDQYHYNDPSQANALLDAMGLDKRDSNGSRIGADGKPLVLRITHAGNSPEMDPIAELLKQQFDAVGLQTVIERVDSSLFDQRKAANEIMLSLLWNDAPAWPSGISRDYQPASKGPWSPLTWIHATSGGKQGREPTGAMAEFYALDSERQAYPPESTEGKAVFDRMNQWFIDNYVFIPTTGSKISVNVVAGNLRNVPKEGAPVELDTYINAEGVWFDAQ